MFTPFKNPSRAFSIYTNSFSIPPILISIPDSLSLGIKMVSEGRSGEWFGEERDLPLCLFPFNGFLFFFLRVSGGRTKLLAFGILRSVVRVGVAEDGATWILENLWV